MKGIVIKLPVGSISISPCSFFALLWKKAHCFIGQEGKWQDIEQSHQPWEVDDLASSPALSLSLPCLHPQSISGTQKSLWLWSGTVGHKAPPRLLILSFPPADSCRGRGSKFHTSFLDESFTAALGTQPLSHFWCPATALEGKIAN